MNQQENTITLQFDINLPNQNKQNKEQYDIKFAFDKENFDQALRETQNKIFSQYKFFIQVDFEYKYKFFPYYPQQKIQLINFQDQENKLQNLQLKEIIFNLQNEIDNELIIKYLQFFQKEYNFALGPILNFRIKGELVFGDLKIKPTKVILSEQLTQYINNNFRINEEINFKKSVELRKFCAVADQVSIQLSYPKIFLTHTENKVKKIIISSNGVQINNIFAYVCYQFQVTDNGINAFPTKVLNYENLQISDQGNGLYNDISFTFKDEQIPAIFDNENSSFSCRHFLIFNISFQKQYCFSKHDDLDIMIPIVIQQGNLQTNQPEFFNVNNYKYLENTQIISSEIKFELDRNTQRYEYNGKHLLK